MKPIARMSQVELAAFVQTRLAARDLQVVLSGGAAVSFYAGSRYVSKDIDLIAEWGLKKAALNRAMRAIGFREQGRYYIHPEAEDIVEILPGPPSIGVEPISPPAEVRLETGTLRILTVEDCIKDRLAAYFHWDDVESLQQALLVAESQEFSIGEVRRWAKHEGFPEKFDEFHAGLRS